MIAKSIRLFLAEGTSHGPIGAAIVNWMGHLLVVAGAAGTTKFEILMDGKGD